MTAKRPSRLVLLALLVCALTTNVSAHAPHDVVTCMAISPDFAQDQTVFASFVLTNRRIFARSLDGGRSWEEYAPAMVGQGIQALVVSPGFADDDLVFAATAQGGVYRSADRGLTWAPVNAGLTTVDARDIAISPAFATDSTLVVVTDAGAFRSTDGGDSWTAANDGLTETDLTATAWSPDGGVIYACGQTANVSFDHGLTWTPRGVLPSSVEDIVVSPLDATGATSVVCFGRLGGGVLASTDHGASYSPTVDGLTDVVANQLAFADDGTLYAATGQGGVFRTDSVFGTWSTSMEGFEELSPLTANHFTEVVVSPDHDTDGTLLCGAFEGVFISKDGAQTWQQQEIYTQRLNRVLAFSPNYALDRSFYVGNYGGGPFRYGPDVAPAGGVGPAPGPGLDAAGLSGGSDLTAAGATADPAPPPSGLAPYDPSNPWLPLGTGLSLFSAVLAPSPTYGQDHTLFYGYVHLYRSTDRGRTWENIDEPQAIDVIRAIVLSPDFADDGIMFIGSNGEGTFRSDDHGDTWVDVSSNLPPGSHALALHMSPKYPEDGIVYLTTRHDGVWRTTDDGASWELLGLDFGEVRGFAVSPAFAMDQTLFAGMAGEGVYVSTDGGASWTPSSAGIGAGEDIIVEDIAPSPSFGFDRTVFVSTLTHGVLRSTDGGASWTDANAGLPLSAGRELAVSPDFRNDRTIVHTNHDWVYISEDAGESWSRLPGYVRVDESHQHARLEGAWTLVGPSLESAASSADPECEDRVRDADVLDALAAAGIRGHDPDAAAVLARNTAAGGHRHGRRIDPGPQGVTAFGLSSNYGIGSYVTTQAGDAVSLTFLGDAVDVYAVRTPLSAVADIEVDGEVVASVDLYSPDDRYQQRVFTKRFAEVGWHTVRLVHSGTANPASGGAELHTDGFAYTF